jgi:hypothetical protein
LARITIPECRATSVSIPVDTRAGSVTRRGTACRDAHHLLGRHVHELHLLGRDLPQVPAEPAVHPLVGDLVPLGRRVGRGDVELGLLVGPQPGHVLGQLLVLHLPVRGDEEPVLVDLAVNREARDEPDVRPLRRLDRADPAVVRDVHVAHLEPGPLAVQATRPERREPPLVRQLRERVRLVNDLAQLAAAEEVLDRGRHALRVDERPRGHFFLGPRGHPLLDRPAELQEALAHLVGGQLVDGPQAPVAQVVDVVDREPGLVLLGLVRLPQLEQVLEGVDEVHGPEGHLRLRDVLVELPVDAEPADAAEPVPVRVEELLLEQLLGLLQLRRITRPELLVDLEQGRLVRLGPVVLDRLQDDRVLGRGQGGHVPEGGGDDPVHRVLGERLAGVDVHLPRLGVDDVVVGVHRGDFLLGVPDQPVPGLGALQLDRFRLIKLPDDGGGRGVGRVHGPQQGHGRELARLVDPDAEVVLLGDIDLDPAAALRDDPAGVEFEIAVDFLNEVHARRAVELADDDALGPVDDELAAADHDRHVAQVDLLLDGRPVGLAEAEPHLERPAVGQAELAALVRLVPRLAQLVLDVLQGDLLVVTLDREDLLEHPLQARRGPLVGRGVELEEPVVRPGLDVRERRDLDGVEVASEVSHGGRFDDALGRDGHGLLLPGVTTRRQRPRGRGPRVGGRVRL